MRGFTLIELLVVLAVIGIATGLLTLSLRGSDTRRLTEEAERLAALFRMAQSESRLTGRAILWQADLGGYRFRAVGQQAGQDAGQPVTEELARERKWPLAVERVERSELLFGREPLREPTEVTIAARGAVVHVALDALGNARVGGCEGVECAASR